MGKLKLIICNKKKIQRKNIKKQQIKARNEQLIALTSIFQCISLIAFEKGTFECMGKTSSKTSLLVNQIK